MIKKIIPIIISVSLFIAMPFNLLADEESLIFNEAKAKVKSILRDPDSSKFQNLRLVTNSKKDE